MNFYQTTRSKNPEDNLLHIRRRENLKSHFLKMSLFDELLSTDKKLKISGIAPRILDFCTRWKVSCQLHPPSAMPLEK
jgi:hypothetical protein